MGKILVIVTLAFVLMFVGCLQQQSSLGGGNESPSGLQQQSSPVAGNGSQSGGSANFQRCISQCGTGNAGNGTLCRDGCRMQEAADTKSTSLCDSLDDQANRPSCYGTVAKAAGNLSVCDRLSNATDKDHCVSVFGSPGAN